MVKAPRVASCGAGALVCQGSLDGVSGRVDRVEHGGRKFGDAAGPGCATLSRVLLTITVARPDGAAWPATDLGYLLGKNPDRVQQFEHAFGRSRVFYPRADPDVCTVALLLEVDAVALAKNRALAAADFSLSQYVNDRPYAASSLLAGALGQVFRSAIRGTSRERPRLAAQALPLRVRLPAVPASEQLAQRVLAPLGWQVTASAIALDPAFPQWGASKYCALTLTGTLRLADALSQLYVLLPVLDGSKHYWISAEEVDKLLRAGEAWLPGHPDRALITRRYLGRRQTLVRAALARLAQSDEVDAAQLDNAIDDPDEAAEAVEAVGRAADEPSASAGGETAPGGGVGAGAGVDAGADNGAGAATEAAAVPAGACESGAERRRPLAALRRDAVVAALKDVGGRRVLDLGCGAGALLQALLLDRYFTQIVGVDVSARAVEYAQRSLKLDRRPEAVAQRVAVKQGSLTYTDASLAGFDAAVLMEVVEHVDPPRLPALEHAVFGAARPRAVVVTTPNAEYNVLYETLEAGRMRHRDHRFEWTREQFARWAGSVADRYGYQVGFRPVGEVDRQHGPSTQMAVFTLRDAAGVEDGARERKQGSA